MITIKREDTTYFDGEEQIVETTCTITRGDKLLLSKNCEFETAEVLEALSIPYVEEYMVIDKGVQA